MISLFLLWFLATLHTGLAGFREAAGRNCRIFKQHYYRRAVFRGVLLGQGAVIVAATVGLIFIGLSSEPALTYIRLVNAVQTMLWIYIPYALLVGITFLLYAVPVPEVRSLTTVAIFGPLTLILPLVTLGGGILAMLLQPRPAVIITVAVALALGTSVEWLLQRFGWARREAELKADSASLT